MAHTRATRSAASRVFGILITAAVVIAFLVAGFLVFEAQRAVQTEAERVTAATAAAIAASDAVIADLSGPDRAAATSDLEPYTLSITASAGLDFVTVMTASGIRITHPDAAQIGRQYLGTIPTTPTPLTETFTGTLGPSVRTIVPVLADDGSQVGWVAAGVTTESIFETLRRRLPLSLGITLVLVAIGALGAWVARRVTHRIAGDLPPGRVRDAVSSYESMRTLGEALRAQTHEHGNRMHTAVALLELGRTQEAIDILTETAFQSQSLVDQVTAQAHGDPTVGALLLGKASQAKERGIDWRVEIEPDTPPSGLSPVDSVAVMGNLIDNAMDAASLGDAERWVRVVLRSSDAGGLIVEVSDSGPGIAKAVMGAIFDHGFSTKPSDARGRGVGLALVRSIVLEAGGSVEVEESPTVFRVTLPHTSRRRS